MSGPLQRQQDATSRWSRLVVAWRRLVARTSPPLLAGACVISLLVGIGIGRAGTPAISQDAAAEVEHRVLPLALDADTIWTSSSDDRPPVAEGIVALRNRQDAQVVASSLEEWLSAYDGVLIQLAGLDLPAVARPVQRQFITAVTLARDAVEVLGHAASIEEGPLRRDLLTEVGRLRQRSEQLTQSARASIVDLRGPRADVSPLPELPSLMEGRRG